MKIADIKVLDRARESTGWLDDLERSIEQLGVLQPIGITSDSVLIFGARRLQACKNLGLEDIPARIINIDPDDPVSALQMEQAENNIRKDFTPTEKVAIARSIEDAMAGRVGRPSENDAKFCVIKGMSRDVAAQAVGWSGETYRKAKAVVDLGDKNILDAVDKGEVSVHKAYTQTRHKIKPTTTPNRIWSLRVDFDNRDQMIGLADKIIEEASMDIAISVAEKILSRYGVVEIKNGDQ